MNELKQLNVATKNYNGQFEIVDEKARLAVLELNDEVTKLVTDTTELNENLDELYNYGITEQLGYLAATDAYFDNTQHSISTKILKSAPGLTYKYLGYGAHQAVSVIFYDENKEIIGTGQYDSRNEYTDIVTPENTAFVKFSSFNNVGNDVEFSVIVPDGYGGIVYEMQNDIGEMKNDISEMQNDISFTINKDIGNLWDGNYDIGYFWNAGGVPVEYKGAGVSAPIYLKHGTYIFTRHYVNYGGNSGYTFLVNENGERIKTYYENEYDAERDLSMVKLANDGYYRFNVGLDAQRINAFMLVRCDSFDDFPETYRQYGDIRVEEGIGLNEKMREQIEVLRDKIFEKNHLYGKKLSVNGDSICAGAGYTGGYAKIIGENHNMTVQNVGVGGGTITAEQYTSSGGARHWICRTIENMDETADYAIVEGGVNDSSIAVPLGAITSGYGSELDDTTFYGAFESMLKQLVIRFAGKKYGYIAVHQMTTNYRASNDEETSYYYAAKKCCEKWGVPFLDLNVSVPPFEYFGSTDEDLSALRTTYTKDGDGWHPNEDGYKKYYVPKIEAWMKTL